MRAAQSLTLPAFEATVAATPDHVRSLEAALVYGASDHRTTIKAQETAR